MTFAHAEQFLASLALETKFDYMTTQRYPQRYTKRMRKFLSLLGTPQNRKTTYIHITGTSGKGSVAYLIHGILARSGKNVGMFTSPHFGNATERFMIQNKTISQKKFVDFVAVIKPALNTMALHQLGIPSYFEIMTAIGFLAWAYARCSHVILEVGCGGRYDATNVIPPPAIAIITNIGLDHTELLGDTKEKIAHEKSGIIKKGSFVLTAETQPSIRNIIQKTCAQKGAAFHFVRADGDVPRREYQHPSNIAIAMHAAQHIGVPDEVILRAIQEIHVPGRFDIIKKSPMIVFDGGHNVEKIKALSTFLDTLSYDKLNLVFALGKKKNLPKIADILFPYAHHVFVTRYQALGLEPAHVSDVANEARNHHRPYTIHLDPLDAYAAAKKQTNKNDLLLVTGSMYLIGNLLHPSV